MLDVLDRSDASLNGEQQPTMIQIIHMAQRQPRSWATNPPITGPMIFKDVGIRGNLHITLCNRYGTDLPALTVVQG